MLLKLCGGYTDVWSYFLLNTTFLLCILLTVICLKHMTRFRINKVWGRAQKTEFTYKNCVFILTCLNFNHLQSTLHLMEYTYWDVFSTTQNRFWTPWFLCLLVFLPFFCFTFITWKNISRWRLFSSEETKKVTQGETRWIEKVGYGIHAIFSQKLLNTESSEQCGQVH